MEKQDFPFTGAFTQIATATANSRGAFTLTAPPLFVTSRLRVVTRTSVVATSPVATVSVAVKVGLKTRRLSGRRTRIEGATWPAVPAGRVSLQRQSRSGKWGYVKRARITPLTGGRSRYTFSAVSRRSRAMNYRVVVLARNGGANVPGTSRTITIPRTEGPGVSTYEVPRDRAERDDPAPRRDLARGRARVPRGPARVSGRHRGCVPRWAVRHHRTSMSRSCGGSGTARSARGSRGPRPRLVGAEVGGRRRFVVADGEAEQREAEEPALQAGHAGAVEPRGGFARKPPRCPALSAG